MFALPILLAVLVGAAPVAPAPAHLTPAGHVAFAPPNDPGPYPCEPSLAPPNEPAPCIPSKPDPESPEPERP